MKKPDVEDCRECKGSGDCIACDGTGLDGGRIGGPSCDWCLGTGVCVACNGSGLDRNLEEVVANQ